MTTILYRNIIGNAWGSPRDFEGVQHAWVHDFQNQWRTLCRKFIYKDDIDIFAGVASISLFHNEEGDFCEECMSLYLETDYGKKFGVHPPDSSSPGGFEDE